MDPKKTAVVLIEYQNDFTSEGGTLHGAVKPVMESSRMLANTLETVQKARELGATIVHAPITFTDDYHELSPQPYGILKGVVDSKSFGKGSWGAEIVEALHPAPGDTVVEGNKSSTVLPDLLAGDRILLVVHGQSIAGIDLSQLKPEDVQITESGGARSIHVTLPASQLFVTNLDNQHTRVYARSTGLLVPVDQNLESDTRAKAEQQLQELEGKWKTYPSVSQVWRRNWTCITPFFNYPPDIRRAIYTTNSVESLNRSLRKIIKTRGGFPLPGKIVAQDHTATGGAVIGQ